MDDFVFAGCFVNSDSEEACHAMSSQRGSDSLSVKPDGVQFANLDTGQQALPGWRGGMRLVNVVVMAFALLVLLAAPAGALELKASTSLLIFDAGPGEAAIPSERWVRVFAATPTGSTSLVAFDVRVRPKDNIVRLIGDSTDITDGNLTVSVSTTGQDTEGNPIPLKPGIYEDTLEITSGVPEGSPGSPANPLLVTVRLTVCSAALSYTVTDLGALPGVSGSAALGLNNLGQVVGWSDLPYLTVGAGWVHHPFLWTPTGGMVDLGGLQPSVPVDVNAPGGMAYAINDDGLISGWATDGNGEIGAVTWRVGWAGSPPTRLQNYLGEPDSGGTGYGINNVGQVVGLGSVDGTITGYYGGAVQWDGTQPTQLSHSERSAAAYGINDSGKAVGFTWNEEAGAYHAARWQGGITWDLGVLHPDGSGFSRAYAINTAGDIVGEATAKTAEGARTHAFLWRQESRQMEDLDADSSLVSPFVPLAINDAGAVVGTTGDHKFGLPLASGRAVLWCNGTKHFLSALVAPGSITSNILEIYTAVGINNAGQIAATGNIGNGTHALLLNPVPVRKPDDLPVLAFGFEPRVDFGDGWTPEDHVRFEVTLTPASSRTVMVSYTTVDGTATTAHHDYTETSGVLKFAPGETHQWVEVPVTMHSPDNNAVDAFEVEPETEQFRLQLSSPTNATIGVDHQEALIVNPMVTIAGFEITQVVQDWQNSVRLVELKDTWVRIHIETQKPDISLPTKVFLKGVREGATLGILTPFSSPVTSNLDANAVRGDASKSLNFKLPTDWLRGTITLSLTGGTPVPDCSQTPAVAPDCSIAVTFSPPPILDVHLLALRLPDVNNAKLDVLDMQEAYERIVTMFPISKGAFKSKSRWLDMSTGPIVKGNNDNEDPKSEGQGWSRILQKLDLLKAAEGCGRSCKRVYLGLVDDSLFNKVLGLSLPGAGVAGAVIGANTLNLRRTALAHELGHALGQEHAVFFDSSVTIKGITLKLKIGWCGEKALPNAPIFPYSDSRLRPTLGDNYSGPSQIAWGLDSRFFPTDPLHGVIDPHKNFELMGYCEGIDDEAGKFTWPSEYTYSRLYTAMRNRFDTNKSAPVLSLGPEKPQPMLLVPGQIDLMTQQVTFGNAYPVTTADFPTEPDGSYTLQALDSKKRVVGSVAFEPTTPQQPDDFTGNTGLETIVPFLVAVPNPAAIRTIKLFHDDALLGTQAGSKSAPTVKILSPRKGSTITTSTLDIAWRCNAKGATFMVLFSGDDGATWQVLGIDLHDTKISIPTLQLPSTQQGRVRVIASSGIRTAEAISGKFTLPELTPASAR